MIGMVWFADGYNQQNFDRNEQNENKQEQD